jgi:ribosomal protein S18 acetylase RimI-like enzyme
MRVRRLTPRDRPAVEAILLGGPEHQKTFNDEEIRVALEVLDEALAKPGPNSDYHVLVAVDEGDVALSYVCWGPTPMTEATFDLYWIATHPAARGQGLAGRLVAAMEAELPAPHACTVRIETSQLESYGAARCFYERAGYHEAGRIRDFYKPGYDLVIFSKRVEARTRAGAPGQGEASRDRSGSFQLTP